MAKILKKITAAVMTAIFLMSFSVPVSFAAEVSGWEIVNSGGQKLEKELDTSVKHSGNASLKMSYQTEGGDNVYAMVRQHVPVEPYTTYKYSMWVRAEKIAGVQSTISWGTRYNLDALGKTFDWKKFEFSWYSGTKTTAEFQFILGQSLKNIWIDDMSFCKIGTDKNLFNNPNFEDGVVLTIDEKPSPEETENNQEANNSGIVKNIRELGSDFLAARYLPITKAKSVSIDGNLDDWENANTISGKGNGVEAIFHSMYDEKYFYLAVETPDKTHVASVQGTGIWQFDSIQFVIGTADEMYGREVTASFDTEGPLYFYSEQWHESDCKKINSYGKHTEDMSIYELAIPWELMSTSYDANNLKLNVLVNDNDNDESKRKFFEFTSGIGTSKTNSDFMNMYCLKDNTLVGAICAPLNIYTDKETACTIFAINNSDEEKNIDITTPKGTTKKLVPANSVYKEIFMNTFRQNGMTEISAEIKSNDETIEIKKTVAVSRSRERIASDTEKIKKELLPELKTLIEECKEKGFSVDYELADYTNIEFYIERVPLDVENNLDFRAEYILNCLFDMYSEAKTNLKAYLSGDKEAKVAYKYKTSPLELEGQTILADMKNTKTGEVERRPMYQMGYNSFGDGGALDYFPDMGFNTLAIEVGIDNMIIQPGGSIGWNNLNRKDETTIGIDYENGESGNSVLKIVSNSDRAANKYLQFSQAYAVKPNTEYEYGYKVKGKNINNLWFAVGGWATERMYVPDGTYDWKEFNYEFTTTGEQKNLEFFIFDDGRIDEAMIDNVYVREKGTKTNLLKNGDYETARGLEIYKDMMYAKDNFSNYKEIFADAAKKDMSICLQIATHYWPWFTTVDDPTAKIHGHFTGEINYSNERVREVTEYYLKNLLEQIKDEPALNSLILGNEPGYCTLGNAEFYEPYFSEYLAYIYSDDINKLNENYKSNYTSFEEVTFEEVKQGDTRVWLDFGLDLSKYETTPIFYDWVNFNYSVYTDWATFMYNTVKKYAPNVKVHIKQLAGTWRYDHDYFRQWLRNGVNAEQLAAVTDMNGCDAQGILNNQEQSLSTKMRWYDYLTSIDNVPIFNSEDHSIPDNSDNYSPQVAIWAGATTWQGAVHGCAANTTWVWANAYEKNGLYASIMVRPDAAHDQAEATLDLNRLGFEVKALTDAKAEVAVMDSLSSHCLDKIFENVSYNAWQSSTYCGQRTDFVTEKQSAEGKLNNYKMVLVPKCDRVAKSTIDALRTYIDNGGRVIMFGEDCLKYDEYGNPYEESVYSEVAAKSKIVPITWTGLSMTSPSNEEMRDMLWQEYNSLNMNKVRLIDEETGKTVYNVEWECANYNDSIIINVNNYDWAKTPSVAIEVNGQKVSEFKELRSMKMYNDTITLQPYEPVLLEIKGNI